MFMFSSKDNKIRVFATFKEQQVILLLLKNKPEFNTWNTIS